MHTNKILSVIVPTYNRSKLLMRLVDQLLAYLPDWAEVIILNNASKNYETVVERLSSPLVKDRVTMITHRMNVCAEENILRSFEYANGEWLWVIGDDDEIYENSFETVKKNIDNYQNTKAFHIHFNWEKGKQYTNTSEISSFPDLLSSIHSIGDLNFISSGIFKVNSVKDFIYWSHFFQCSATPLTSLVFLGLNFNAGTVVLSNEEIINNGFFSEEKDNESFWDVELVLRGLSRLPEYPFNIENKTTIINYLKRDVSVWLGVKCAIREYLKGKPVSQCIQAYNEVLNIKIIYGNMFSRMWISIVALLIRLFVKPMALFFNFLKKRKIRF